MKRSLLFILSLFMVGVCSAQFSISKVVLEEATGAWCQYCPDGAVIASQIDAQYPNAIWVSLHNGDAMEFTDGATVINEWISGFPSGLIQRDGGEYSRNQWNSTVNNKLQGSASVTVSFDSLEYNETTRQLSVKINAQFTGIESGDIRFNIMIVEKEVTGTGSGYNQVNAYNNTPGHTYYQAGNPILGFVHENVVRTYLDGPWGTAGVIPSSVNFGTTASYTYTYTLPASYDETKIFLVGIVNKYGAGSNEKKILNAEEADLPLTVGIDNLNANSNVINVYPNPVMDRSKIEFTLAESGNIRMEVLNTMGQTVKVLGEGFMNSGIHTLYWNGTDNGNGNVANGVYFVRLITENGQSLTKRMLLNK